jgi:hypothetical protein
MPSRLLGRAPCPECGFESAHVKESEPKRTLYRYCPGCGAQYFPRGETACERLRAAMRPEGQPLAPAPAPLPESPVAVAPPTAPADNPPEPPPPPPPARARRDFGLFKG